MFYHREKHEILTSGTSECLAFLVDTDLSNKSLIEIVTDKFPLDWSVLVAKWWRRMSCRLDNNLCHPFLTPSDSFPDLISKQKYLHTELNVLCQELSLPANIPAAHSHTLRSHR